MGMFNWVAFEMDCPKCCTPLRGFQTKEGDLQLKVVLPWTVSCFYSWCEKCKEELRFQDGEQLFPKYDTGVEMLPYPPNGRKGP